MSWREQMCTNEPNAENDVRILLQKRGLLSRFYSEGTTIVFFEDDYRILHKESVTKKLIEECVGFTIPDFLSLNLVPFYLDGPVHLRRRVQARDERINELLRKWGFEPQRWPYKPPMSRSLCNAIVTDIQKHVER